MWQSRRPPGNGLNMAEYMLYACNDQAGAHILEVIKEQIYMRMRGTMLEDRLILCFDSSWHQKRYNAGHFRCGQYRTIDS